ncbi:phosphatase PAP2 family protein, partial [Vibrio sp. M260118]|uniref:phosphatase PAP2 family protein n=1 Tax=Vibrio sp. M260118 TaxID=3020896 RepID=UPI002F3EC33D
VAYSRLWLGMHRPEDLVGSILFVGLVYLLIPNLDKWTDKLLSELGVPVLEKLIQSKH